MSLIFSAEWKAKFVAERGSWGGEVRTLRNEMKTVKSCWGKWDSDCKHLWGIEGPAEVRPSMCDDGNLRRSCWCTGREIECLRWSGTEVLLSKEGKRQKIMAREWLKWWTVEIRLEKEPGKGWSHMIDVAWRFSCSRRGLQGVKSMWTRGKGHQVQKRDSRGVCGVSVS